MSEEGTRGDKEARRLVLASLVDDFVGDEEVLGGRGREGLEALERKGIPPTREDAVRMDAVALPKIRELAALRIWEDRIGRGVPASNVAAELEKVKTVGIENPNFYTKRFEEEERRKSAQREKSR